MSKPTKYVVSVVLKKTAAGKEFLVVKRPEDDKDLPGHWGFPSVSLAPGELPEEGALRVCKEKLGCACQPLRFLGIMFQKRNSYDMFLMDIEAVLEEGGQPSLVLPQEDSGKTMYIEQKWSVDPMDLMPAATKGSCCASIFLTDRGLFTQTQWIESLEGSSTVG